MSFWPFPKTILDELSAGLARGPGVELGAGDGRLARRLGDAGLRLLTVDRQGPVDVRADARRLPLRAASCGAFVLANVLRHLRASARRAVLAECARALADGGRLLILEDEPVGRDAAEVNYRRALELLAAADPTRGAALDLDEIAPILPGAFAVEVDERLENAESVDDPRAPLRWLAAHGPMAAVEALSVDVERQGMAYGQYRALVLRRCARRSGGDA